MPERVNSFGSVISGVIFTSLVITINFDSSALAESPCIEHPPEPVAEVILPSVRQDYPICASCNAAAMEVLFWSVRYDRAKGRKCWFLSDAYGRDVTEEHMRGAGAPTTTQTIWSKITSVFDTFSFRTASFTAAPTNTTTDAPQNTSADLARKRQVNAVNANKADDSIRINPKNSGEAGATKQQDSTKQDSAKQDSKVSLQSTEQGLYEDFLRWREAQELIKTPEQREQRKELGLYEEFLRWSTPDSARSMQPLMGKAQL
jgi:hypothetical protein